MCKPDNDSTPAMQSQESLSSLIGNVERAAAEVSRVALQHRVVAHSPSHDTKLNHKKKKKIVMNAPTPASPTKETNQASHSIGLKPITPDAARKLKRHQHQEKFGEEEEEEGTTIGTRTKKRRRIKSQATKELAETEKGHKRTVVNHNYHDYATDPVRLIAPPHPSPAKKGRGGISSPFPMVLHDMLNRAKSEKFEHIVSWQPHGRCFLVHDQERFVKGVMPMFFRQSRFSSFQRQLSLYGFLRLTRKNEDYSAYYHEFFLRGRPHLCAYMQRTRVKGYWVRQSSSPDTEPDFYSMPFVTSETDSPNRAARTGSQPSVAMPDVPDISWSIPRSAGPVSHALRFPPFFLLPSPATGFSTSLETRNLSRFPPMPLLRAPVDGAASRGAGVGIPDRMVPDSTWNSPAFLATGMETTEQQLESNSKWDVSDLDSHTRRDLVAFLSDVDLATDNEDEDHGQDKKVRAYRDEKELGRIFAESRPAK
jgi:hypothetical protein